MSLVLIGGAQRSGTTLLQTLIANALAAPVLPEAHILCDLMASYQRAKDAPRKTRFFYASDAELLSFFRASAQRHIEDVRRAAGVGDALVLKDPNFVRCDAEAAEMLPEAVRIVCLRDPRDIAASFLKIGQRETDSAEAGKYRRRDIHFIGKKIAESYAGIATARPKGLHVVRYEELVAAPARTLQALGADAGLEFDLARIDDPAWLEADARHDKAWISALEEGKPSTASVGAYKTMMRPREIALLEQICAGAIASGGYEPSSPRASQAAQGPMRFLRGAVHRIRQGYWSYRARFP
jgi:hypothetical protein